MKGAVGFLSFVFLTASGVAGTTAAAVIILTIPDNISVESAARVHIS